MTLEVHATLTGFSRIDFDRKRVRKTMQAQGKVVQRDARKLVARKALSEAGNYPGRVTGRLYRAIRYKVSKSGFMVVIRPEKSSGMKDYYPAFLLHGTSKGIEPRGNYIADSLKKHEATAITAIRETLQDAIQPRK